VTDLTRGNGKVFGKARSLSKYLKLAAVGACVLVTSACGALQSLERVQGNMDRMTYYMSIMASNMPVMAHSTYKMSQNTDRMMARTDSLIAELEKKSKTGEKAIQNYGQAFVDNNSQVLKSLWGIRDELRSLKDMMGPAPGPTKGAPKDRTSDIEARLDAIAAKMADLEKRLR